jgi:hypothetical protein
MSVKQLFHPISAARPTALSPLKTTAEAEKSPAPDSRISRQILSNKKVRHFLAEKIDGVYPATISSALGSGQPHPVVVTCV